MTQFASALDEVTEEAACGNGATVYDACASSLCLTHASCSFLFPCFPLISHFNMSKLKFMCCYITTGPRSYSDKHAEVLLETLCFTYKGTCVFDVGVDESIYLTHLINKTFATMS